MMDNHFVPLLIIASLAFLVPLILSRFKKLRLPIVVGEILAGIVIGHSGLQLIPPDQPIIDFMAELGFVFLMFISGMEIDFSTLALPTKRGIKGKRKEKFSPLGL